MSMIPDGRRDKYYNQKYLNEKDVDSGRRKPYFREELDAQDVPVDQDASEKNKKGDES